jgi:putative glutamine amidotransferase
MNAFARAPSALRPVLGLIACTRQVGGETAQAVIDRYVAAASRHADSSTVLVPTLAGAADPADIVPRLDGLLLTGSLSNVETHRYGVEASDAAGPFDPDRDDMAMRLVAAMLDAGKPVFGICRGLQELNVAFGGKLRRDLGGDDRGGGDRGGEDSGALRHHAAEGATLDQMFAHEHDVTLAQNGVLRHSLGAERIRVNSVHYQGIDTLGDGLTVEATADDGVVEAVSAWVGRAPVLAVQWHPEWNADADPQSAGFFQILGRALRGLPLAVS